MYFCYGSLAVSCNRHTWMIWAWAVQWHHRKSRFNSFSNRKSGEGMTLCPSVSCQLTVPCTVLNSGLFWHWSPICATQVCCGKLKGFRVSTTCQQEPGINQTAVRGTFFLHYALSQFFCSIFLLDLTPPCPPRHVHGILFLGTAVMCSKHLQGRCSLV